MTAFVGLGISSASASGDGISGIAATDHAPPAPARFPVRLDPGKRHLVDADGRPLFLHVDTAWSLIADLSREEAELYLEDRRQKGFNGVLVNLLERKFARNAPRNFYGQPPFSGSDAFSAPNPEYFAHADFVIRLAASKGMLVLLTPSYLGYEGGAEGWYAPMRQNAGKLRDYGRFLGRRYATSRNVLWVHGGDHDPADKSVVREIVFGILEFDRSSLHTAHGGPGGSATDHWSGDAWLRLNSIYTYTDIVAAARKAFAAPLPFLLIESRYENEAMPEGTELRMRAQAYQALLTGAAGHVFGNNPVWHFSHSGLYPIRPPDWKHWLDSPGARSMMHLRALVAKVPWWTLHPDWGSALLARDTLARSPFDRTIAASTGDGRFALIYVPSPRTFYVDLGRLAGPWVRAQWFDPSTGAYLTGGASAALTVRSGFHPFATPGRNGSSSGPFSDWVLVLESVPS